jgi:hypothetical protein
MNFNPYQNYGAGLAALGPVQSMSDRNAAQTLMANSGQMFASGGIARLASGGALPKYKYDPVSQTYVLSDDSSSKTAMDETLRKQTVGSGYDAPDAKGVTQQQAAVFDFMNTEKGASYKDAFGRANNNMITGFVNPFMGQNPLAAFLDANAAYRAAEEAARTERVNNLPSGYETVGGPSTYSPSNLSDVLSGYQTGQNGLPSELGGSATPGSDSPPGGGNEPAGGGGTADTGGDGTGSGADAGSTGDCVDPAVLIMLGNQTYVPAGTIKVGDVLFAMHEKTQEFGLYPVEHSEEVQQPKAIVTFDDGSTMTTSHSHKFFMTDGSWKQVYQLEPADVVKAIEGKRDKAVASVEDIGEGPVMKITVSDAHTYVSEDLISHNMKAAGGRVRQRYAMGGSLGGLAALAAGGQAGYNLGGYSDGGRLLRGPGDGVSDSIPAIIGSRQPARLADGEFVVPARIVSELGNGSTEAGARKLYAMMDRIQQARNKTVGKNRVAVNSRADKNLPA